MFTPLVKCHTSLGDVRPHTRQVFDEIVSLFKVYFAWGIGPTGDHKAGKALDFMSYGDGTVQRPGQIRPGWNMELARYGLKHHARLGIRYVIADRTIWSSSPRSVTGVDPWEPKAYNGDDPHVNHNHWSLLEDPPAYRPPATATQEDDMPTARDLWTTDLVFSDSAAKMAGFPKGFTADAEDVVAGTHARVIALARENQAQYKSLLENVQQEDPRWQELNAQLAAEKQARVAFEERVIGSLQGVYAKLDQIIGNQPKEEA